MSNFVSYRALSPFRCFSMTLSSVSVPRSVPEALTHSKWKDTMVEEMRALEKKTIHRS